MARADATVLSPVAEHEDLRKVLRDILETHASHEEVRRRRAPRGLVDQAVVAPQRRDGVGSLAVPEARGGLGFGVAVLAVVLEEAGRVLLPEPLLLSSVLGARAVLAAPADALPRVAGVMEGRLVVTVVMGDAGAGLTVSDKAGAPGCPAASTGSCREDGRPGVVTVGPARVVSL